MYIFLTAGKKKEDAIHGCLMILLLPFKIWEILKLAKVILMLVKDILEAVGIRVPERQKPNTRRSKTMSMVEDALMRKLAGAIPVRLDELKRALDKEDLGLTDSAGCTTQVADVTKLARRLRVNQGDLENALTTTSICLLTVVHASVPDSSTVATARTWEDQVLYWLLTAVVALMVAFGTRYLALYVSDLWIVVIISILVGMMAYPGYQRRNSRRSS